MRVMIKYEYKEDIYLYTINEIKYDKWSDKVYFYRADGTCPFVVNINGDTKLCTTVMNIMNALLEDGYHTLYIHKGSENVVEINEGRII